jgi:hypothetical protein
MLMKRIIESRQHPSYRMNMYQRRDYAEIITQNTAGCHGN